GVQVVVVEQAAPGAAVALEVRAAEKVVEAPAAERGVEAPEAERGVEAPEAERTPAECRPRTSTFPRMVSRGPSFRRFPRQKRQISRFLRPWPKARAAFPFSTPTICWPDPRKPAASK